MEFLVEKTYQYSFVPYDNYTNYATAHVLIVNTPLKLKSMYIDKNLNVVFDGAYDHLSIVRNGYTIASNYTDYFFAAVLGATYTVTPYNMKNTIGLPLTVVNTGIQLLTKPVLVEPSTLTSSSIQMLFTGTYSYVMIQRNGHLLEGHCIENTYMDIANLVSETNYTYTMIPFDARGRMGSSCSIFVTTPKSHALGSHVFYYTGSSQLITVPKAAKRMTLQAWGAGGGTQGKGKGLAKFLLNGNGGGGGYSMATLDATTYLNKNLEIIVGQGGQTNDYSPYLSSTFGNGGGQQGDSTDIHFTASSGGGKSSVSFLCQQ